MSRWAKFFSRRKRMMEDLDQDIRDFTERETQDHIERGMFPEEARYAALRRFGNVTRIKEDAWEVWGFVWLEQLWQDIRFGVRVLAKNRGFTAVAVLTLALGIGANTAIFTMINAVMLRDLPVKAPARLILFNDGVSTGTHSTDSPTPPNDIYSYGAWDYLRTHQDAFAGLCAFRQGWDRMTLRVLGASEPEKPEPARAHLVSGSYFAVLGVGAATGRLLTEQDDTPASPPSAIISYDFWLRRFHAERSAVGKAVELNGAMFTIVGVTPREFFGERVEAPPDFWLPLSRAPQVLPGEEWLTRRDLYWLNMMGRLKPGVSVAQAQASLNTQYHQFYLAQAGAQITPKKQQQILQSHIQLKPGGRGISTLRFKYSQPLHILMAVVAVVLLIACANVATLMLARASSRGQELFVRLAMGAGRGRVIRQLLTESILLAVCGASGGVVLAVWGVHLLSTMLPLSSAIKLTPDATVLAFAAGVAMLTGVLFGFVPALRSTRVSLAGRAAARSSTSGGGSVFKPAYTMVVVQVALSCVLLTGAALLTHSLLDLERQDLGFNAHNVLVVRTDLRLAGLQPGELLPFYRSIQERLKSLPGVTSAAIARFSPISGSVSSGNFSLVGYQPPRGKEIEMYDLPVGPGFFQTLDIPVLLGRTFGPEDTPASPPVAVVNQTFAREYLPNQNPIGRRINFGEPFEAPGYEIIGVVADSRYYAVRDKPEPMAFFSIWQAGMDKHADPYAHQFIIRTAHHPANAVAEVRQAITGIDSRVPVLEVQTLHEQISDSLREERLVAQACSFFGLLALVMVCVGLYGTMSYAVTRRTNEIGIRMALGAQRSHVAGMFLRDSAALVALGVACGLPMGLGASRGIRSLLYGVPNFDWMAIGGALALLVAIAALAAYLPARRATKVEPMVALRYE
jgi:predicted permease